MLPSGPSAAATACLLVVLEATRWYHSSPAEVVVIQSAWQEEPPTCPVCQCECVSFTPPMSEFRPWDSSFGGQSWHSAFFNLSLTWVCIVLVGCVFICLSIIRCCVVLLVHRTYSTPCHVSIQTMTPLTCYSYTQTQTRVLSVSIGVQTDIDVLPRNLALQDPLLSGGPVTPARLKAWRQAQLWLQSGAADLALHSR